MNPKTQYLITLVGYLKNRAVRQTNRWLQMSRGLGSKDIGHGNKIGHKPLSNILEPSEPNTLIAVKRRQ